MNSSSDPSRVPSFVDDQRRRGSRAVVGGARRAQVAVAERRARGAPVAADVVIQRRIDQGHRGAVRVGEGGPVIPFDAVDLSQSPVPQDQFVTAVAEEEVAGILVGDGNAAIGRRVGVDAEHNVAARRNHQRPAVIDHVGVDVVVLDGPAVDVHVGAGGIEQFEPLAVRVGNRARILHDFVDDDLGVSRP
jgi:hypothetical protein